MRTTRRRLPEYVELRIEFEQARGDADSVNRRPAPYGQNLKREGSFK